MILRIRIRRGCSYMVFKFEFFVGRHFTFGDLEEEDVSFVRAHKTACELLSEARPSYGPRRLGSQVCFLSCGVYS